MDTILIIANILSLLGNICFTTSALFKSKRKIILFQSLNHTLSLISEVLTKAYSGVVQDAVSLVRNFVLLFIKDNSKRIKILISIICAIACVSIGVWVNIAFSDNIWYGYLPIIANLEYSIIIIIPFVIRLSDLKAEFIIKVSLLISGILWGMYGFFIQLYPIMIFNGINVLLCTIAIIRITVTVIKKQKMEENEEKGV